jgi:hypothetical protein
VVALSLTLSDIGYTRTGDVNVLTRPSRLTLTALQLAGSGRIYGVQENIPQVNAVQLRVRLADGWDPLLIESYVSYMQRAGGYSSGGYQLHIPYDSPAVQPHAALLGLMNVSVVVSRRPLTDPRLRPVGKVDGTFIYRNTADAGPAYLVQPGADGNPPSLERLRLLDAGVHTDTLAAEQETFSFTTGRAAYLVLATPAFPGWNAELDGQPAAIQLFAGVMPAIKVGPGTHTLSYMYAPTSVRLGAMLSALGLLAALAWLVIARLWKPGKPRRQSISLSGGQASVNGKERSGALAGRKIGDDLYADSERYCMLGHQFSGVLPPMWLMPYIRQKTGRACGSHS